MEKTEFLKYAKQAAREAADVLESWSKKFTVSEKSRANLVTEADFAAQQAIHDILQSQFPDHGFLGEEDLEIANGDSPYRWVIDPLDGTSNYVHRFPYYAVSIALECDKELIVGVIYDPNRDEMFTAIHGEGAHLNGAPIRPTGVTAIEEAMVVASLPVHVGPNDVAVKRFLRVLSKAQTVQRTGSAALNLCYVAAGRMDAYFSTSLKPWDMAAGALIVSEAGGCVGTLDGKPLKIEVPDLLACNGTQLREQLTPLLVQ
ncbi:MAG: inositol monophosphatase family protein [Planctomycetaceae bacterium]